MELLETLHTLVRRTLMLRGAESRLTDVTGHTLHYYRARGRGRGAPLVLVHGLGGNANGFARLLFRLAAHFPSVYALDFPGSGFSPLPESGPLALEEHLRVLHAFCREVVRTPALLVGNSLGGALAMRLAAEHPEDVCGLGLLAPAGARLEPQRFSELMERLEVHSARQGLALTRRLFHRAPLGALLFSSQMTKTHNTPAVRAIRARATVDHHLSPDQLARVKVPTLLLWAGSEKLLPGEMLAYFRRHLPASARIEVVEKAGHVLQMERPREVVHRLADFAQRAGLLDVSGPRPASDPSRGSGSAVVPNRA